MRILALTPHYLPGFRAGGPIRSLSNLVERLGREHEFSVLTSDRDLGDDEPYAALASGSSHDVGHAQVYYTSPNNLTVGASMIERVRRHPPDLIYLNGLFHAQFAILPLILRRLGLLARTPVLVAPRGELSAGALSIKSWKKTPVLTVARMLRCYRSVAWHATCDEEAADIRRIIGPDSPVYVAANLTSTLQRSEPTWQKKQPGTLRLAFVSRLSPKKNLHWALDRLAEAGAGVSLDIWGPREDAAYWNRCEATISKLPPGIESTWRGELKPHDVVTTLSQYDALFLPTLGENFGHVIAEAMAGGCPLLISDRTPWRNLQQRGIGWDISLDNPNLFVKAINTLQSMNEQTHLEMRRRARNLALSLEGVAESQMREVLVRAAA